MFVLLQMMMLTGFERVVWRQKAQWLDGSPLLPFPLHSIVRRFSFCESGKGMFGIIQCHFSMLFTVEKSGNSTFGAGGDRS